MNPLGLGREARRIARERDENIAEFKRRTFDHALVANATMRGRTIVQDKVTPLGDVLKSSDNHFSLIDRLINLTIECWKQGFCETTFNFTVNHGVTADGKVVVIDVGELTGVEDSDIFE